MLSETSFSPVISASIRSSMALRFSARRSSSSPLRPTGRRSLRLPVMMRCAGPVLASMGPRHGAEAPGPAARDEAAAAESEHHDDQDRPLRGLGDDAEQPPPLGEVAQ